MNPEDRCAFCQERPAVADVPPIDRYPTNGICVECMDYRTKTYPKRAPCVMREKKA